LAHREIRRASQLRCVGTKPWATDQHDKTGAGDDCISIALTLADALTYMSNAWNHLTCQEFARAGKAIHDDVTAKEAIAIDEDV